MKSAELAAASRGVASPGAGPAGCLRSALAVFVKDARCELRSRHALGAVLLFAVTSTVAVSFALGAWGSDAAVSAGMLWIVIYFSAMSGLSRSFVREEEMQTAATLKLATRPNAVYLGKLAFNLALLLAIEVVTIPLFVVLMGCSVRSWGTLAAVLALGSLGLSCGGTMAAAMVAKAATRSALYAVISFPLLVPVLGVAIHGTTIAMEGGVGATSDIRLLAYYCGAVLTACIMLFRFVWED